MRMDPNFRAKEGKMILSRVFATLNRLLPAEEASAHCDIPCGIYDPHPAQIAAQTVVRMNQLLEQLPQPGPSAGKAEVDAYENSLSRYIAVKEQHAELVKRALLIIWGGYFKSGHREKFPDWHATLSTTLR